MCKPPVLIVAPHIDDEMIGCWSVLNRKDIDLSVLYMHELTERRIEEALCAAFKFDFTALFNNDDGANVRAVAKYLSANCYSEVYVPSRRDWHPAHQAVNRQWRHQATHFYSVDMAHGVLLPDAHQKRAYLDECYPSQANLWTKDDKYWLFEDIQECDYDEYTKLAWTQPSGRTLSVTVLKQHEAAVVNWYLAYPQRAGQLCHRRKAFMHELLSFCKGKVIVEYDNIRIEA
jgi:hypothetical protein